MWQPHAEHLCKYCKNDVAVITGTKNLTQFKGTDVIITYTTRKKSYGRFMWMPLPQSPMGQHDFALTTIEQKRDIDNRFTKEECLMEPQEFREMVIEMTTQNGFDSFVRLLILSCGKSYFGKRCKIFVVSIVSYTNTDKLRRTTLSIMIDVDQEKVFEVREENIQDPHIPGTVVF
jgi:hypothetical protein